MKARAVIGVDLGGTNLKVAVVDRRGTILAKRTQLSRVDRGPNAVIEDIVVLARDLRSEAGLRKTDIAGLGIGTPGPVSVRDGVVLRAGNLPNWQDVPLQDELRKRLRTPVALDNDGNCAALGEVWLGAGKDGADMVVLTLGTGVGAGVIIDGRLLHGHFENAGELGHMIVQPDGLPCPCGQHGCLEAYASAGGLLRRAASGTTAGFSEARGIIAAAQSGDATCLQLWNDACFYLAVACVNIQHAFNPARVVLAGGLSRAGEFLRTRVDTQLRRLAWPLHNDVPEVALTELDEDAGVLGAAALLRRAAKILPRASP